MLLKLSIAIPSFLVFSALIIGYIYRLIKIRDNVYVNGIILSKIDINTRKIYTYDYVFNNTIPKNFYLNKSIGKWSSLDSFLDHYKGQVAEKKIRSMLVEMQSGKSFVKSKFALNTTVGKARSYNILFSMFELADSSDVGVTIKWKLISKKTTRKSFVFEPATKIEIANIHFPYKGFIAFKLKSNIANIAQEFIYQLGKITNFNNKFYFITNGILVIVMGEKKAAKLKNKILKLVDLLESKGQTWGLNRMYSGTAYTVAKEVDTPKRINSVLELLSFNINLSLRTGKHFANKNTSEFSLDEYRAVSKGTKVFKNAIKYRDIQSQKINVYNWKTNRKIMVYSFPYVENISDEITSIILRNQDNLNLLRNTYSEMVAIEKIIKEPVLVDINNNWLADNYEKMVYKRAIYVLNYDLFDHVNTEKIVKDMTDKKFTFAIRLKSFNQNITTILKKTKPQFIVIDKKLSNVQNPENYIQLLSIKKLSEQEKIRIIYENPSNKIDSSMAEVLNIKYVYKFE